MLSGDPNGRVVECWTVLGAWAESTSGVEIRCPGELQRLPQPRTYCDGRRRHDELGFTLFTWTIGGPNYDLKPLREWISWRDKTQRLIPRPCPDFRSS